MSITLTVLATLAVQAGQLEARYVGNQGFEISDGTTTILTDLPYRSGAFGYRTYDFSSLRPRGRVISLITHRHADHFDPSLFAERDWQIVGPEEVTRTLPQHRVIPRQAAIEIDGVTILPYRTPHRDTEHYSYLVEWSGVRLYFVGDTEDPTQLLAMRDLDVAFMTPWLLRELEASGGRVDADRIVIYHHRSVGEARCDSCVVPRRGDVVRLGAMPLRPRRVGGPGQVWTFRTMESSGVLPS